MKVELNQKKETNAVFIVVAAEIRYWEDAAVNDIQDELGRLIPFRNDDLWSPKIHIDSGKIIDWPQGTIADIHYKVCDGCGFSVIGEEEEILYSREEGYVPSFLCPKENGYGDYIIMDIDEKGFIDEWDKSKFQIFFAATQKD